MTTGDALHRVGHLHRCRPISSSRQVRTLIIAILIIAILVIPVLASVGGGPPVKHTKVMSIQWYITHIKAISHK